MMKSVLQIFVAVVVFFFLLISNAVTGQVSHDSELFITMQRHDSLFFERGFNLCDTNYLKQAIHKDLVFYHDKGGISNKAQFMENTKKNLCSDWNNKPIRKVRRESLEVYPLYDNDKLYGVVQSGVHDFFIRVPGKPDAQTGTAKFTHVYLLEGSDWILKEVLSFDHK